MALVTLQTIFQDALPASAQTHPLPAHVRRAARAIIQCRTAALGGHVQACPDGHMSRIWYHSCRHRACPQCVYLQTERWLARQQARWLACDHSHVIFTLPHDRNPLWLAKVPLMTTLLFQAVRETHCTLLAATKYLGAQPGIIAALHPWSQTLVLPPHVHCLVTGGGLTAAGDWKAVRNGVLLPARVVMAVLRGKRLAAIRQALACGELTLPEPLRPQPLLNLLNRLGHPTKTKWNVRIMERYRHGTGVVTSLARSRRGGPLKNGRLVACEGDRVTFTCRARPEEADGERASSQRLTLAVADFLQRWLLHVPVPQTRVVRSYGRYHPPQADALAICRAALGQPPVEAPVPVDWQTACAQRGDAHPERCPACGQVLVCTGVIPRGGAPPRMASEDRAAGDPHRWGDLPGASCAWGRLGDGYHGLWTVLRGGHGARHGHHSLTCGAGRACHRPDDGGWLHGKLHSARRQKPSQAASVRGLSNQELTLHLAVGGGVAGGVSVAARRSLTPNAFGFKEMHDSPGETEPSNTSATEEDGVCLSMSNGN
jgi:hypothetical protein